MTKHSKKTIREYAVTFTDFEFRTAPGQAEGDARIMYGYAALFNSFSQNLGGFREIIRPGAFAKTIQEADIRALWNHDSNLVIGRNKAETLVLSEDDKGLKFEIDPPQNSMGDYWVEAVRRGDVDQMSFTFRTIKDKWIYSDTEEPDQRELIEVQLYDISPVTFPAYESTEVGMRMLEHRSAGNSWVKEPNENILKPLREPFPAGHSKAMIRNRLRIASI